MGVDAIEEIEVIERKRYGRYIRITSREEYLTERGR